MPSRAPKAPVVALVLFWIYRRQRPLYLESLVFVLHFQSFFYLIGASALLLAAAGGALFPGVRGWIVESFAFLVYAWSIVYLFVATRRVYRASVLRTVLGLIALGMSYAIAWLIGISVAGMYAFMRA